MSLKDKSVLITGGSRGLGRALAFEFAKRGARVTVAARPSRELSQMDGVFTVPADVSDKRSVYPLVAQAAELAGPVDVLINNASTLGPVPLRPLLDTDCEDLESAIATNLVGPFRLTKAVLGSMLVRKRGVVVNISSDAAVNAYPNWGAYSATKAALAHLTKVWQAELEGTSVRLLNVDPGEMDTKMHADAIPGADRSQLARPEDVARRIVNDVERFL